MQFTEMLQMLREHVEPRVRKQPWLLAIPVAILLVLALLITPVLHTSEIALFAAPLDAQQTADVDEHLASWGIPHHIRDGAISIDASRRNAVLLRLRLAGLPHEHLMTSGESLAKLNALTPDSLFQAQARVGTAGDLALALRGIDGIEDASVVIAPAVTQAFSDEAEHPATAAVRLTLKPGLTLTPQAVAGIRQFIAGGIAGLTPDHVTLLDDHGIALGAAAAGDAAENARSALQSAFDQAFGAGRTIVRVHLRSPHRMSVAIAVDRQAHLGLDRLRALAVAGAGLDLLHGDDLAIEEITFVPTGISSASHYTMPQIAMFSAILSLSGLSLLLLAKLRPLMSYVGIIIWKTFSRNRLRVEDPWLKKRDFEEIFLRLQSEPAYVAAAVLSRLPAATAAAVLQCYRDDDRNAIASRMARRVPNYLGNFEPLIRSSP